MKTTEIKTLLTAALAALTPIVNQLEEPDSFFTRAEKTRLSLAYWTLTELQQATRHSVNQAQSIMPWEADGECD